MNYKQITFWVESNIILIKKKKLIVTEACVYLILVNMGLKSGSFLLWQGHILKGFFLSNEKTMHFEPSTHQLWKSAKSGSERLTLITSRSCLRSLSTAVQWFTRSDRLSSLALTSSSVCASQNEGQWNFKHGLEPQGKGRFSPDRLGKLLPLPFWSPHSRFHLFRSKTFYKELIKQNFRKLRICLPYLIRKSWLLQKVRICHRTRTHRVAWVLYWGNVHRWNLLA